MKILIIDGSRQITERMKRLLLEADDTLQVASTIDFGEASEMITECKPDVVILDVNLPAGNSLGLLKHIKGRACKTCVIALSIAVPDHILEQWKLGADYLLDKYSEFDKIPALLHRIRANKKQITIN